MNAYLAPSVASQAFTCTGLRALRLAAGRRLWAARKPVRMSSVSMAGSDRLTSASIQGCASRAAYQSRWRSGQANPSANMQWPARMLSAASARTPSSAARPPARAHHAAQGSSVLR